MIEEGFSLPTGEQMKEEKGADGFAPLPTDDYIVKVAKILLKHEPTWNAGTKSFDYSKTELSYTLICLPYKLKAEEGLVYANGATAKPLTGWVRRKVNPFAVGQMPNGEPTFLRAFIAYAQGVSPDIDTPIALPGVVVLNKDNNIATDEETDAYKVQFKKYIKKEITIEEFTTKNAGFKHIPDIRSLEGKYVGAKIILDDGRNKITGFSKLPSTFSADATIEAEAMTKFAESYKKMQDKRAEKVDVAPSQVGNGEVVNPGELPF